MANKKGIRLPRRKCPYCDKDRAISMFKARSDICKFCEIFDRSARITEPNEQVPESTTPQ